MRTSYMDCNIWAWAWCRRMTPAEAEASENSLKTVEPQSAVMVRAINAFVARECASSPAVRCFTGSSMARPQLVLQAPPRPSPSCCC